MATHTGGAELAATTADARTAEEAVTTGASEVAETTTAEPTSHERIAWITIAVATWLTLGVILVSWALDTGATTDSGFSVYHVPGYLSLLALAGWCGVLVARAVRAGRPWRTGFPTGYGVLGGGLAALLAYVILDIGWREGVGIARGIEGAFAPSRILLIVGMVLVAIGPLRAELLTGRRVTGGWPAVLAAALTLGILWLTGGLHPAQNAWAAILTPSPLDDVEVWMMAPDGTSQTRLLEAAEGVEWSGATWSPDGTRIAVTRWQAPVDGPDEADIWIVDADGTDARPLVEGTGWQWIPHWSPDGAWIVYTAEGLGGPGMEVGPVPPVPGQGPGGPAFASAPTPVREYSDVWRIASDGSGAPEQLTDAPGDDRAGSYSPDGRTIVFDSTRDGDTELYLMDADGSNERRLTFDPGSDWGQSWSPDGSLIAFNSTRSGWAQIWVVSPDGGEPTRITDSPSDDVTPIWSPDGSRIAFTRRADDEEVWSVAPDGSDPRNLSRSPASHDSVWDGAWAADGRILFTRAAFGPAVAEPLVQEDLAVATLLLVTLAAALVAATLALVVPPFGTYATLLAVATTLAALPSGTLWFVPLALLGGLLVDLVIRLLGGRRRVALAAAGACAVVTAGCVATLVATSGIVWSTTLTIGVVVAGVVLGWAVGAVAESARRLRGARPMT
jgi:Tol biopolymer transport system component